ncbi:MAG: DUF192 domain-containing protein [Patescibacteria group bacterium]|jgi:hypothetical protein
MGKSMVTFLAVGILLIAFAWAIGGNEITDYTSYYFKCLIGQTAKVEIKNQVIKAEVVKSTKAKAKGLSHRRNLPKDKGMLFVFDQADKYEFWMKDMKIPLDIIWINDGKVVDISRGVFPPVAGSEPVRVKPTKSVKEILEVYSGVGQNWQIGDQVNITFGRILGL